MKILILGLGNDLLSDDGVGLLAVRALREELGEIGEVELVESPLSGLALLDLLIGYDRVILIDAVQTGQAPPGTIWRWRVEELGSVRAPSPHYAGLPEMLAVARALQIPFPERIEIYAMEVADPLTIGGDLTPAVREALPELVRQVREQVREWKSSPKKAAGTTTDPEMPGR
ncbi:MAG: hydrogenase maturation protease [Thermoflexus sp.]|uniref:hydrogenase maturation protease n=1 Tax=Thermoflexus sp. TaxID=1969742 RepID=UPI0025CF599F|nr:hydrogenase maturation protease [Thermoflexus sp.]MCS6965099.1 hydrogenase maturation protease [Thermoflexus sp.]